jgi:pimeloyl-ACP methyl ester carboxylesterase
VPEQEGGVRTASAGGTTIAYARGGSPGGEPVLLLHGLGSDHRGIADLADRLPGADVVTPDLPGFGGSPPLPGPHTMAAYADALEALRTRLDLGRLTVVGHSLGADIALVYAARHAPAVRALCLLNPVVAGTGPTAWLGRAYYRLGSLLPTRLARAWLLSRPSIYLVDGVVIVSRDPALRARIRRLDYDSARTASPRAISEAYLSLLDTPFADLATRITAPSLVVTGSIDRIARPAAVAGLCALIPRSRLVVVEGAGHLWPAEDPVPAGALVAAEFLAGATHPWATDAVEA